MHRRKFLSLVSGAVAAVAGGLGLVSRPNVVTFGAGKPYEKTLIIGTRERFYLMPVAGVTRWKTLEEIVSDPAFNQEMLQKIADRRAQLFNEMVRANEAFCFDTTNVERLFNA